MAEKTRHTRSQVGLSRAQRQENLTGAFRIIDMTNHDQSGDPRMIIIIDDVLTTGSTLIQLASMIKKKHPMSIIWGACLARNTRMGG